MDLFVPFAKAPLSNPPWIPSANLMPLGRLAPLAAKFVPNEDNSGSRIAIISRNGSNRIPPPLDGVDRAERVDRSWVVHCSLHAHLCIFSAGFGPYRWRGRRLRILVQYGSGHHQFDRRSCGQFSYKPISGEELDAEKPRSQRKIPSFGESCQHGRLAHDPDQPHVADRSS